jgi:hypothetical protein
MTIICKKFSLLKWILPFLALFIFSCSDSSPSKNAPKKPLISKFQPKDSYYNEALQMTFPKKVGDFTINEVTIYNQSNEDISVEYITGFMGFAPAVMEIYIYPAQSESDSMIAALDDHYQKQKDLLLSIFPSAYEIEEGQIKIGRPWGPEQGLMLKFKRQPNEVFPKKQCYEKLYIFEHSKWIIKYRVTNPTDDEEEISKKAGNFMQILQWPMM